MNQFVPACGRRPRLERECKGVALRRRRKHVTTSERMPGLVAQTFAVAGLRILGLLFLEFSAIDKQMTMYSFSSSILLVFSVYEGTARPLRPAKQQLAEGISLMLLCCLQGYNFSL